MPGAVLRVSGSKSGVQRFLNESSRKPIIVYWKGKPKFESSKRLSTANGFNHAVSNAPGSRLELQIRDAKRFLVRERKTIALLKRLKLHSTLDFGVEATSDAPVKFYRFDVRFLAQLSEGGIDLELSHYLVDGGNDV
jgi:hypothetical protein